MRKFALVFMLFLLCLLSWNPQNVSAYTWIDRGWADPISMPKTLNEITYNDYAWLNAGAGWSTLLFYNTDSDSGCTPFHNLYLGYGNWSNYGVYGTCHWFRTDCNPAFSHCTSDDYSSGTQTNGIWGGSFAGFTHSTKDVMKSKADLGDYTPYGISNQVYQTKDRNGTIKLTVTLNPQTSGTVASNPSSNFSCSNGICTGNFSGDIQLTATPADGYAFGYWDNGSTITNNPYVITMDASKQLTAKYFKTFRNSVGSFYANIGDIGGECVDYVKSETGITKADGSAFDGDAWEYYQKAIIAGYQTSDVPRSGAIAVFDKSTLPDVGHVGIVISSYIDSQTQHLHLVLRHSNWCMPATCHTVSQNDVDVDGKIIHYIYFTP